jgi:hypothetical protein
MSSRSHLIWREGVELKPLLKVLHAYMANQGFTLTGGRNPLTKADYPYRLSWLNESGHLEQSNWEPSQGDPLREKAFRRLSWTFFSQDGDEWFVCSIFSDEEEGYFTVRDEKLLRMCIAFDEEPSSWALTCREAEWAVRKYHQIYELYKLLNCDEVNGYSDNHYSAGTSFEEDPDHLQKIFRFAKKGRQILIAPMEEGRARRDGEDNWRVIIDP